MNVLLLVEAHKWNYLNTKPWKVCLMGTLDSLVY